MKKENFEFRNTINLKIKELNLTNADLCEKLDISEAYLEKLLEGIYVVDSYLDYKLRDIFSSEIGYWMKLSNKSIEEGNYYENLIKYVNKTDIKELINHCFTTEEGIYVDFNLLMYFNHKLGLRFSGGFLALYHYTNGKLYDWNDHIEEFLQQRGASKRSLKRIIDFLVENEIINETRNNKF